MPVTFSAALEAAKQQQRVRRAIWADSFIVLMPRLQLPSYNTSDTQKKVNDRTAQWIGKDTPLDCSPYFALGSTTGLWQPGWLPTQGDLMAEDWEVLE